MPPDGAPAIDAPEFWDEAALLKEEQRQFDVCHGCRLCWNFCPAFPALFEKTDAVDGEMGRLTRQDLRTVEDSCYQCKLCFIRCPYTPPHKFALDVPRLLMRARLANARKEGVKLADRLLADTDLAGRVGAVTAPLANAGNGLGPVRLVMEQALGIHRKAALPRFHTRTFASWFSRNQESLNKDSPADARKAALFYGCSVNYNDPAVGIAAAQVLAHNGVRVSAPQQQCCGMPFLDAGALEPARRKVRANVQTLREAVRQGHDIVVASPSCSLLIKQEYPQLQPGEDARLVAERTFDCSEYLWKFREEGKLKTDFHNQRFRARVRRIGYHVPCHVRAQFMGNKAADLMGLIPDVEVEQVERCSGHDGTWGVKKGSHMASLETGQKLFQALKDAEADLLVTDCPLASLQIEQGAGARPVHPMQVLKEAYGI